MNNKINKFIYILLYIRKFLLKNIKYTDHVKITNRKNKGKK